MSSSFGAESAGIPLEQPPHIRRRFFGRRRFRQTGSEYARHGFIIPDRKPLPPFVDRPALEDGVVALDFVLGQRPLCVLQHHVEQGEVIERRHNVADRNDVAALCRNGVGVVQRLDLLIGQFAAVDGAGMISERDLRIAVDSAAVRNPFFRPAAA